MNKSKTPGQLLPGHQNKLGGLGHSIRHAIGLSLLWAWGAAAAIPELEEGVYLQSGSGPLTVKPHTTPSVIDWNNDGRKDLLVGQFDYGYIWLFLNQGTDAEPALSAGQLVYSGAQPITTGYG